MFAFLGFADAVAAATIPLPRPRPVLPMTDMPDTPQPPAQPAAPAEPSACQIKLQEIAVIEMLPPIVGPGDCGGEDLVRLLAVVLENAQRVPLVPPAILRCPMATEFAGFVRDDIAPVVAGLNNAIATIDNYDSYACRGRNRIPGAKLSEHGRANALDIRGFRLANKVMAGLTDPAFSRKFREDVRRAACARFRTVLGPGSDGYHEGHIHLDLAERRNGYRLCQWEVRDPAPEIPLPRPRPAEAP